MLRRIGLMALYSFFVAGWTTSTVAAEPQDANVRPAAAVHSAQTRSDQRNTTAETVPAPGADTRADQTVIGPSSSAGLQIVPSFDNSITADSNAAAIQNAINQAITALQSQFSDPITVSIYFRYAPTAADNVTPLASGTVAQSNYVIYTGITWARYVNALQTDASTSNDFTALTNLPVNALSTNVVISSANGRAVGFNTPGAMNATGNVGRGTYDGIVTLNSNKAFQFTRPTAAGAFDATRSLEHEIDEILGLGSFAGPKQTDYRPQDIFSYASPGVRSVATTGSRYFSIDGGVTNVVGFNQDSDGDYGDWLSDFCPQTTPYVQNAFSCTGQYSDVTATSPEAINLDVIGYNLASSSTPITPTTCTPSATTLCLSGNRFAVSATWQTSDGKSGQGQAVALTSDTGYFWFFQSSNVEMVTKVLNACGVNSRVWVFAGGLTNVQVAMTVIDTKTGKVVTYANPQNTAFQPIQDTNAFSTCTAAKALSDTDPNLTIAVNNRAIQKELLDAMASGKGSDLRTPAPNSGPDNCNYKSVVTPITINGSLTTASCINDITTNYDDVYAITGSVGQQFTVDYSSSAYDTYLIAEGDPSQNNFDLCFSTPNFVEAPGGTSRATATCTFAKTGTYFIHAASLWDAGDTSHATTGPYTLIINGGSAAGSCSADDRTLCLANNRFAVSVTWQTADGNSGNGTAVPLTSDTGYFWFFQSSNVEMVTKVLNGCGFNARWWAFAGGLTNVQTTMTVRDTETGAVKTYTNPQNTAFQPIQDTSAFSSCP